MYSSYLWAQLGVRQFFVVSRQQQRPNNNMLDLLQKRTIFSLRCQIGVSTTYIVTKQQAIILLHLKTRWRDSCCQCPALFFSLTVLFSGTCSTYDVDSVAQHLQSLIHATRRFARISTFCNLKKSPKFYSFVWFLYLSVLLWQRVCFYIVFCGELLATLYNISKIETS